jgi:hypothetical protein
LRLRSRQLVGRTLACPHRHARGKVVLSGGVMEHQRFEGERTLMRIHIGESDRWHGAPLYEALINCFARKASPESRCCVE